MNVNINSLNSNIEPSMPNREEVVTASNGRTYRLVVVNQLEDFHPAKKELRNVIDDILKSKPEIIEDQSFTIKVDV